MFIEVRLRPDATAERVGIALSRVVCLAAAGGGWTRVWADMPIGLQREYFVAEPVDLVLARVGRDTVPACE